MQRVVPENPRIGIVVLAHDRSEYLRPCLDSLFQTNLHNYDVTFLIQDDGSSDPEVRNIIEREYDSRYRIFRTFQKTSHGSWGGAFNQAMKDLLVLDQFDIVGSCDSDAFFHPEWLDQMIKIAVWAKAHHKVNALGPFSCFNSSDWKSHKVLGRYSSPYGRYWVKERMDALNYFYFIEDFQTLGFLDEDSDDGAGTAEKLTKLKIRSFCTETTYVEHLGHHSVVNQWRPTPVDQAVYGLHLAKGQWLEALARYGLCEGINPSKRAK
jgi:glycosyltransferase involved in cell wall biosynthesis